MPEPEEPAKKTILCYGDSNTWGYVPAGDGARFASHVRWPGVLSKLLRTEYRITEEGLSGRTTCIDDPLSPGVLLNGLKMLGAVLATHKPLDIVIIFLGTNDLKCRYSFPPCDIAEGVELLVRTASQPEFGHGGKTSPDVLVICPPSIWEVEANFGAIFRGGREKSQELKHAFSLMSARAKVPVLYAEDFIQSDPADGIHLSAEGHGILGQEVAKWILERESK